MLTLLNGGNMTYLESLYEESVDDKTQWSAFFSSLPESVAHNGAIAEGGSQAWFESSIHKQAQVSKLIMAYRSLGHLLADVDPIGVMPRGDAREVELSQHELGERDLDTEFDIGDMGAGGRQPLREILAYLREAYCGPIGYEIRYLTDLNQRAWLQKQVETHPIRPRSGKKDRKRLLAKLTAAEGLEKYLHTKYVGQKRFSLEGGGCVDSDGVGHDPAVGE